MSDIRFSDLTPEQQELMCNGCGPSKGIRVPQWVFKDACNEHDFNYWLGCTEEDRIAADKRFGEQMDAAIASQPWWHRMWLQPWAWLYFHAVRMGGKDHFYYGPAKRTIKDLEQRLAGKVNRDTMGW